MKIRLCLLEGVGTLVTIGIYDIPWPVTEVEGGQGGPWPTLRFGNSFYTIGGRLKKIK
jgi:hypothetical protein